jgi:hypothetical protein
LNPGKCLAGRMFSSLLEVVAVFTLGDAATEAGGYESLALPVRPVARLVVFKQKFQCTCVQPHAAELVEAFAPRKRSTGVEDSRD